MSYITYSGSFKLPDASWSGKSLNYGGYYPAYRPKTDTLVMRGRSPDPEVIEVTIPTVVNTNVLSSMQTATIFNNWYDITYGKITEYRVKYPTTQFTPKGIYIDENDDVQWSISAWYNTAQTNYLTHGMSNLTSKQSYGLWTTGYHSLLAGGYITRLSKQLATHYNRNMGCGENVNQGSSGTNQGPALYVYDMPSASLPNGGTIPTQEVLTHRAKTPYPGYWPTWQIHSMVCLPNSVLYFGRRGKVGCQNWYGEQVSPEGYVDSCVKPKGYHSSEYSKVIWEISNNDLINGVKNFTEHSLDYLGKPCGDITGSAVDYKNGRLFVLQQGGNGILPIIHVYSFKTEQMYQEQIDALNASLASLTQQVNAATTSLQEAQTRLALAEAQVVELTTKYGNVGNELDGVIAALLELRASIS